MVLTRLAEVDLIGDPTGKPIAIDAFIPPADPGVGSSDGDRSCCSGRRLGLIVHHDHGERAPTAARAMTTFGPVEDGRVLVDAEVVEDDVQLAAGRWRCSASARRAGSRWRG